MRNNKSVIALSPKICSLNVALKLQAVKYVLINYPGHVLCNEILFIYKDVGEQSLFLISRTLRLFHFISICANIVYV